MEKRRSIDSWRRNLNEVKVIDMDEVITEEIAKRGHTNSNHVRMGWIERKN